MPKQFVPPGLWDNPTPSEREAYKKFISAWLSVEDDTNDDGLLRLLPQYEYDACGSSGPTPLAAKPPPWAGGINRAHPLATGLIAALPLNNRATDKIYEVARGLPITINGSEIVATEVGPASKHLQGDFASGMLLESGLEPIVDSGKYTIAFWVKLRNANPGSNTWQNSVVFQVKWTNAGTEGFVGIVDRAVGSSYEPDNLCLKFNPTDHNPLGANVSTSAIGCGWHHIALSYNSSTQAVQAYVDGEQIVSTTGLPWTSRVWEGDPLGIGCVSDTTDSYGFNGYIGQFLLYNRPLDKLEVRRLYEQPHELFAFPTSNAGTRKEITETPNGGVVVGGSASVSVSTPPKRLTIRYGSIIPEDNLTDFPKLFVITGNTDIATECASGGGIYVTLPDATTQVPIGLYPSTDLSSGNIIMRAKFDLSSSATEDQILGYLFYSSDITTTEDKAGVVSNGYELFMPMEQDPSTTSQFDWVTESNIGASNGSMVSGNLVTGQVDHAISFDGSNDYINVPHTAALNITSNITVECLFKADTFTGSFGNRLVAKWDGSDTWALEVSSSDRLSASVDTTAVVTVTSSSLLSTNTTYYGGFTYDGSNVALYLNNVRNASAQTGSISTNTHDIFVGIDQSLGFQPWDGFIDEVRVASVARSSGWMKFVYNDELNNSSTFSLTESSDIIYTETPNGGVVVGGSALDSASYTLTATGGVVVDGNANNSASYTFTGADGVVVGGTATSQFNYNQIASGGIAIGGAALNFANYTFVGNGGMVVGGTALTTISGAEAASGGVVVGGDGLSQASYNVIAAGGIEIGGDSTQQANYNTISSGGVVVDGVAEATTSGEISISGGVVIGGTATSQFNYNQIGSGGVAISGNALNQANYTLNGSGGIVIGGDSLASLAITKTVSGGAIVDGSASSQFEYNHTASGGVVADGDASGFVVIDISPTGGDEIDGTSTIQAQYNVTSSGGVNIGGNAEATTSGEISISGGLVASGTAIVQATYNTISTSGVLINGLSTDSATYNFAASGGVVIAGNATSFSNNDLLGTGGVNVDGEIIDTANYNVIASGGDQVGGSVVVNSLSHYFPSGGIIVGGDGASHNSYIFIPTGGMQLAGSTLITITNNHTSTGGVVVGGSSTNISTNVIRSSGGFSAAGLSINQVNYEVLVSGGLTLGGETAFGEVEIGSGGVVVGGSALNSQRWSINGNVGISIAGTAVVYTAKRGLALGGQTTSRYRNNIDASFDFSWQLNHGPRHYYRVESHCVSRVCPPISDSTTTCSQGSVITTLVLARSLTEVCEKLQDSNMVFPIKKVTRFDPPAVRSEGEGQDYSCTVLVDVTEDFANIGICRVYQFEFDDFIAASEAEMSVRTDANIVQYEFTNSGKLSLSGSTTASYTLNPSNFFSFTNRGGLTLSGVSSTAAPYWHFTNRGGLRLRKFVIKPDITSTRPLKLKLGGKTSANIVGTEIVTVDGIAEMVADVSMKYVEIEADPLPDNSDVVNDTPCCEVDKTPLVLLMRHNFDRLNVFNQFLSRNKLVLPSGIKLRYNTIIDSWQGNLSYKGNSINNTGIQIWNLLFEFGCTTPSLTTTPISPIEYLWRYSLLFSVQDQTTRKWLRTKIVSYFSGDDVCTRPLPIDFEFIFDVDSGSTNPASKGVITFTDEIGLFKSKSWVNDPELKIRLFSIDETTPTRINYPELKFPVREVRGGMVLS